VAAKSGAGNISPAVEVKRLLRYQSYLSTLNTFVSGIKKPSIFEIGCGPGSGLNEFVKAGWNVLGLELDNERANYCEKKFNIKVVNRPVDMLDDNVGVFDIILVSHVLEHIHELQGFLESIIRRLKTDGFLFLEVPDLSVFIQWYDAIYFEHQQTFTFSSLIHLLNLHGLQVVAGYRPKTSLNGVHHIAVVAQKKKGVTMQGMCPVPDWHDVLRLYQKNLPSSMQSKEPKKICYIMKELDNDWSGRWMSDSTRLRLLPDGRIFVETDKENLAKTGGRPQARGAVNRIFSRLKNPSDFAVSLWHFLLARINQAKRQEFDIGVHDAITVEKALFFPPYARFPLGKSKYVK
jgi:SAM-dependent methyltransferase